MQRMDLVAESHLNQFETEPLTALSAVGLSLVLR